MKKLLIILLFPISIFSQYIPGESSIIVDPIKYMHKLLNEYRVENGLDTVALDTNRIRLAQEWAEYLDTTNQLYHSGYGAENCLYGSRFTSSMMCIKGTLQSWKESPGHNKNLLYPSHNIVGYGYHGNIAVMLFGF
jgi:uncharacterized protein YkwD